MTKVITNTQSKIDISCFIYDNYEVIPSNNTDHKKIIWNTYSKIPDLIGKDYEKHLDTVTNFLIENKLPISNLNYVSAHIHYGMKSIALHIYIKKNLETYERILVDIQVQEYKNE